jgi:hypothetical protein
MSMSVTARHGAFRSFVMERWIWLVPFVVAGFVYFHRGGLVERGIAGLVGLVIIVLAARKPDRALIVLIIGLPFQGLVLAQLYAWGMPAAIIRPMSAWKEALAIGVIVAGIRGFAAGHRRLDRLDLLALAYVAVLGIYALVPHLFSASAPTDGGARFLAWRASALFVLLLLGARHAQLPEDFLKRAMRVVMAVGTIVAAIAAYEFFFSGSWNDFIVHRLKYPAYQIDILDIQPQNFSDIRFYGHLGNAEFVRVGSVFLNPLVLGFYLVIPFAAAVERTVRAGIRGAAGACLVLTGAALLFTQTRAALFGAVIVGLVALRPTAGRGATQRARFGLLLLAAAFIALPAATATGFSERATTTTSGTEESAVDHVDSLNEGIRGVAAHPLGQGLATSAGTGQRFAVEQRVITENYYLQVGIETGLAAMGLFIALTLTMLRRLRNAVGRSPDPGFAAVRGAALGLAVGAFFLHTFNDLAVSWTLWSLAGAVIGIAATRARSPEASDARNNATRDAVRTPSLG